MPRTDLKEMTAKDWYAEGVRRFGEDRMAWKFVCPTCGHIASVAEWKAVGAPEGAIGFACVGRWTEGPRDAFGGEGPGPCNYTGGGLFQYNPLKVTDDDGESTTFFEFAEAQ